MSSRSSRFSALNFLVGRWVTWSLVAKHRSVPGTGLRLPCDRVGWKSDLVWCFKVKDFQGEVSFLIYSTKQCYWPKVESSSNRKGFCALSHSQANLPCFFFFLQLSPGSSLCHCCSLMFLYTGQYTISISCSDVYAEQVPSNDTSSAIAENSRSSETLRRTSVDSLINETRKSWTFSPPIKIHVVEWWFLDNLVLIATV